MSGKFSINASLWNYAAPIAGCVTLGLVWGYQANWLLLSLVLAALFSVVIAAVHHAEIIALRLGEPFGTLILALAVTAIEASLIVALMLSGGEATIALARDTVFATVMIICNGVVGLCLLLGAMRHRVVAFRVEGTTPALSVLATLATLTLVLPSFTSSTEGPTLSSSQLIFVGIISMMLYCTYIFIQTVRHRDYFLPVEGESEELHAAQPTNKAALVSFLLLVISLVSVVGLAKVLAPSIEAGVKSAGMPHAVVGIAVALMVLLPETWAAARAALLNRMQTSFNLALGSALATIGLTIPAVVVTVLMLGIPLTLGLPNKEIVLLALTLLISTMTLSRGRSTVLQGAVHLVVFAVYLFLAVVP
ncbi:MAG: ionic transporter y4hA [Pseudomonadota bacterium]